MPDFIYNRTLPYICSGTGCQTSEQWNSVTSSVIKKITGKKAALESEDDIRIIKDGQSSKATYYRHIHTLLSLYTLSEFQQNLISNMCFLPSFGLSARIFANLMHLSNLNEIHDLIETGFIQTNTRHTISLHPMIQEIALSETKPSVSSCHTLLDFQATLEPKPEKGISVLQKLSKGIKEYNSDCCLDYAIVQETLGTIYLMTANLPQAKTHFNRAFKIYEKIWADEPEMIEKKYREIQELYPQVGFFLGQQLSTFQQN